MGGREVPCLDPIGVASGYFTTLYAMDSENLRRISEWFDHEFYNSPHFVARDSPDAVFMRSLALRCWTDMQTLIRDWREFVNALRL